MDKKKGKDDKAPTVRMKTILVTGCNRGIGLGIIETLLEKKTNHRIVMTARDDEKGQAVYNELSERFPDDKERFFYHQLDITNEESISEIVQWIKKSFKKIDYIVSNAGVSSKGLKLDTEVVDFTFSVNVYGTITFTEKMVTSDCINKQGKIILLGSLGGHLSKIKNEKTLEKFKNAKTSDDLIKIAESFKESVAKGTVEEDGWPKNAYSVSKMIINTFARVLAHRKDVSKEQCSVYACDPGWTKTEQGGEFAKLTIQEGAETPVFLLMLPDGINKENQGKFFFKNKITPFE